MCGVDGKVGWAPPTYLKKCEDKMESDESDEEFVGPYSGKEGGEKNSDIVTKKAGVFWIPHILL